jgi:LysR family transcriptional regulator, glycine cleavage system transcriptional activator
MPSFFKISGPVKQERFRNCMNGIHMRRYRNVPPLQFLHGFEAAARLSSFSLAATELGLSQSAVSHQIRLLEDRIGQPLFRRVGRTVLLTDAGRDYQRSVRRSLELLEDGYKRLAPFRKTGSVVIYSPRDFASRWLLPRLGDLRESCPDCDPWIDTSGVTVDFEEMEVSVAIVYAPAPPEGYHCIRLLQDIRVPVLSHNLVGRRKLKPIDLLAIGLLHDERAVGWNDWFQLADPNVGDVAAGIDFSDSDLALAAADAGLGVALASLPLTSPLIGSRRLVVPVDVRLDPGSSWYAVSTDQELADQFTVRVWNWFESKVGSLPASHPNANCSISAQAKKNIRR